MAPVTQRNGPTLRPVESGFSVTGQIRTEDLPALITAGFRALICSRPDHEDPGQQGFAILAAAAHKLGLQVHHIPVSGSPTAAQVAQYRALMATSPGPVLGWCRSGGRAETLHRLAKD